MAKKKIASWIDLECSEMVTRDIRDLTQLGRERRRRRLLKFELPVFTFLLCVTLSFLFNFA